MIRLVEQPDESLAICQTIPAARIWALWQAWANLPPRYAPSFYRAEGGATLAVMEAVCTLEGTGFEAPELLDFLALRGCGTLVCSGAAARLLGCEARASSRSRPVLRAGAVRAADPIVIEQHPPLPQVYRLLADTFDNMSGTRFDSWYADVSHKTRHGLAQVWGVLENGVLNATAGIYHQNAGAAVIGSVATRPCARGRGFASALVLGLAALAQSSGKAALIAAENEHARSLYERLGFVPEGELCEVPYEVWRRG